MQDRAWLAPSRSINLPSVASVRIGQGAERVERADWHLVQVAGALGVLVKHDGHNGLVAECREALRHKQAFGHVMCMCAMWHCVAMLAKRRRPRGAAAVPPCTDR